MTQSVLAELLVLRKRLSTWILLAIWWVLALMVCSRLGSKITMSASKPTAIVPFFGNNPKIFAAAVDVSSTNRFRLIRF